jgi:hypothetical protein
MGDIATILVASFAIDRIVTGLFFLLSYSDTLRPLIGEAVLQAPIRNERAARTHRLVYALFAGYLGIVIIAGILNVRLSALTKLPGTANPLSNPLLDTLLTGLILAGGADRIADALKLFGAPGPDKKSEHPIEITGKLILEQPEKSKSTSNAS